MPKKTNESLVDFFEESNEARFQADLHTVTTASIGVIMVRTRGEFYRVAESVFDFAIEREYDYNVWSSIFGWKHYEHSTIINQESSEFAPFAVNDPPYVKKTPAPDISAAMRALMSTIIQGSVDKRVPSISVVICPDPYMENPVTQDFIRALSQLLVDKRCWVILVSHTSVEVPQRIMYDVHVMDYKTPNASELSVTLDDMIDSMKDEYSVELQDHDKFRVIQNAIGMTNQEFTSAIALAIIDQRDRLQITDDVTEPEGVDVHKFVDTVLEMKTEQIKKSAALSYMPSIELGNVGGLDLLKEWIAERRICFTPEAKEFGIDAPKGILAVGPPGTGKSLLSKAVASELNVPCIAFDVSKVFGQYVGQSESQMRTTLSQIEDMAPCVLVLDEIDKAFAGMSSGGGDSGVGRRVFGAFLTWMQERSREKPIFVVMTANRVNDLPAELTRKGRLDDIFAVRFPMVHERQEIIKIHFRKRGHKVNESFLAMAAAVTDMWVGAELEAAVNETLIKTLANGEDAPSIQTFTEIAAETKRLYDRYKADVEFMDRWAKENARPASTLDPETVRRYDNVGKLVIKRNKIKRPRT